MAGPAWYDVIALATSKGGAGKSTLARGLAAHWFAVGRKPALIDADPTATLSKRYNPQGKLGAVPVVAEPEELVAEVIGKLRARHTPVIVDTAGFRNRTTISALVAADLAIIPLKPAAEDLDCAIATYELVREINDTPERQLEAAGYPLLQAEMPQRVAYPEAAIEGLSPSVTDPDGAAARDIAAIVHELLNLETHELMKPTNEQIMDKAVGA
jgi:chromosome partitioning protein